MGWLTRGRRGVSWKDQTLDSISAPPLGLMVFLGLFIMLMIFETYSEFQEKMERSKMKFRLGLLLLPLVGILVVTVMLLRRRWWLYAAGFRRPAVADDGSLPWGLMLVLVLLIVMVYYRSSFQSFWFRSI
ncbi:hypothetical protein PHJA_001670800 [Phtheirospermum japonicum]|uniref:Uncharacterized protein n=1 Tax=Phtheirospermum japonicum TaxID=374723 RepID=A0A830CJI8_9LAMI|nr:hypothetical protein PHJA_001670800 [Phtheirospermum japonicum]